MLTGALCFTEGDSLGGGGAAGSPWITGAEAASAARFGPEG